MGKIKYVLAIALLGSPAASFAQFTNNGGSSSSSGVEAWKGLRVSYEKGIIGGDYGDFLDEFSKNGFSVGYEQAFRLSKSLPIFIQSGLDLSFTHYGLDDASKAEIVDELADGLDGDFKINNLGLTVPVDFVYAFKLNDMLTLKPYTGFYFKVNLTSKGKLTLSEEDWSAEYKLNFLKDETEKFNEHITDETGYDGGVPKDDKWNRVQVGWQIGATLDISKFNVGFGYGLDFNELSEKVKASKFTVKMGYNF